MEYKKLRGDHCRCVACNEYFNSTKAFDKHRIGRCMTVGEMLQCKMVKNSGGWWLSSSRDVKTIPRANTTAITGAAIP